MLRRGLVNSLIIIGLLLLVGVIGAGITHSYPLKAHAVRQIPDDAGLLAATNQARTANGVPALTVNQAVQSSSEAKCADMVAKHYWAHIAPDGTRWDSFINSRVPHYSKGAENLSYGYPTDTEVVNAWLASPPHRAALLNPAYTEVGFAVCNSANHPDMVVEHLIAP